jgi:hypothetical protein
MQIQEQYDDFIIVFPTGRMTKKDFEAMTARVRSLLRCRVKLSYEHV